MITGAGPVYGCVNVAGCQSPGARGSPHIWQEFFMTPELLNTAIDIVRYGGGENTAEGREYPGLTEFVGPSQPFHDQPWVRAVVMHPDYVDDQQWAGAMTLINAIIQVLRTGNPSFTPAYVTSATYEEDDDIWVRGGPEVNRRIRRTTQAGRGWLTVLRRG